MLFSIPRTYFANLPGAHHELEQTQCNMLITCMPSKSSRCEVPQLLRYFCIAITMSRKSCVYVINKCDNAYSSMLPCSKFLNCICKLFKISSCQYSIISLCVFNIKFEKIRSIRNLYQYVWRVASAFSPVHKFPIILIFCVLPMYFKIKFKLCFNCTSDTSTVNVPK